MQLRTNTRIFTIGIFYRFDGSNGAGIIRTGVFTIPGALMGVTWIQQNILIDGLPGAKMEFGTDSFPGSFGTLGMGIGNTILTPQPQFVPTSEEIIIDINTNDVTQGDANITFIFVKAVR